MHFTLPRFPVSCGAMLFDEQGRLLIVKPTYKDGWTLPGGIMEADGETPWEGCRREVREEVGLEISSGALVAVDVRPAKKNGAVAIRFLFHCGRLSQSQIATIVLQRLELSQYRFVDRATALELLRPALSRRVASAWGANHCVYLEDGRPVATVAAQPEPLAE